MAFHADKRGKAAELNAAGVRVVILAVMFLMSMVDPAIMDRWPLHRKPSVTAQHSATFRQSQTLMQSPHRCMNTAGNCRPGVVRLLFYQRLMIDGNIISPQACTPPIPAPPAANLDHLQDKCPSSDQRCFLTQHRPGSSKRLELIRLCEAECQDETKGRRQR